MLSFIHADSCDWNNIYATEEKQKPLDNQMSWWVNETRADVVIIRG